MPKKRDPNDNLPVLANPRTVERPGPPMPVFHRMTWAEKLPSERFFAGMDRVLKERKIDSRKELEAIMEQLRRTGAPPELERELTPEEKAQDLVYDAWEAKSKTRRRELARKALELWPGCSDAYVLLAEDASSPQEARKHYEKAFEAAVGNLDPGAFEKAAGYLWAAGFRPYMRARAGLARCLWQLGERDEAISHFAEMLRLNQPDNQGLRYALIHWLLIENRDAEARKLLRQYDDDTALWLYPEALVLYRSEGETKRANRKLKDAMTENEFVPLYLLGQRKEPKRVPEMARLGSEEEAMTYVGAYFAIPAWRATEGALKWLENAYFWFS